MITNISTNPLRHSQLRNTAIAAGVITAIAIAVIAWLLSQHPLSALSAHRGLCATFAISTAIGGLTLVVTAIALTKFCHSKSLFERNLQAYLSDSSATGNKRAAAECIRRAFYHQRAILHVGDLRLNKLPSCLGCLTTLQTLDLSGNQLTELPDVLGRLVNLQELYLGANQLTELPDALGELVNLKRLGLHTNQLTELPDALGRLVHLQVLYLGANQLTELPDVLGRLVNLQELYLGANQLTELPDALGQLVNLQELYLGNNRLIAVPAALGQLQKLQCLDLQENLLPIEVEQLENLQNFYAWANHRLALQRPPQLEHLDQWGNMLIDFSPNNLGQLQHRLHMESLIANPLQEICREIISQLLLTATPEERTRILCMEEGPFVMTRWIFTYLFGDHRYETIPSCFRTGGQINNLRERYAFSPNETLDHATKELACYVNGAAQFSDDPWAAEQFKQLQALAFSELQPLHPTLATCISTILEEALTDADLT